MMMMIVNDWILYRRSDLALESQTVCNEKDKNVLRQNAFADKFQKPTEKVKRQL